MRKITLLLTGLLFMILCVDVQAGVPELSTDNSGPWYIIKVKGSANGREGLALTPQIMIEEDRTNADGTKTYYKEEEFPLGDYVVRGRPVSLETDSLRSQLWRVEAGSEDGFYKVVNKVHDQFLSLRNNTAAERDVMVLDAVPTTEWKIYPAKQDATHCTIETNSPVHQANMTYAHQGNSGFFFGIIMELAKWGEGLNSQYQFIPVYNGMTIDPLNVDFGMLTINGEKVSKTITVTSVDGNDTQITYKLENKEVDEANGFWVPNEDGQEGWSSTQGGTLTLEFYPDVEGEFSTNLILTIGEEEVKIPLKGKVISPVPVELSPSKENSDQDVWYRIYFDRRSYFYMQDLGEGEMLETYPYEKDNDGQLWKFVQAEGGDGGDVKIYSKLGHEIGYNPNFYPDKESDKGRFIAVKNPTEEITYKFEIRADGSWQLIWNEYWPEDEEFATGTNINKTNNDNGFCAYKYNPDDGNSMLFKLADEEDSMAFPVFSNEGTDTWYHIQFYRQVAKENPVAIINNGVGVDATQDTLDVSNAAYYWKLTGSWKDLRVIGYDNTELFQPASDSPGSTQAQVAEVGEGTSYMITPYVTVTGDTKRISWMLTNNDETASTYKVLNDHGGGGQKLGQWSKDAGSEIIFVLADPALIGSGLKDLVTGTDFGPVVETRYYTAQGVEVREPSATGIYIRKNRHASGKISASKFIYRKP